VEDSKTEDNAASNDMEPGMVRVQDVIERRGEASQGTALRAPRTLVVGEEGQVAAVVLKHVGVVEEAVDSNEPANGDGEEDEGVDFVESVEQSPAISGILYVLP